MRTEEFDQGLLCSPRLGTAHRFYQFYFIDRLRLSVTDGKRINSILLWSITSFHRHNFTMSNLLLQLVQRAFCYKTSEQSEIFIHFWWFLSLTDVYSSATDCLIPVSINAGNYNKDNVIIGRQASPQQIRTNIRLVQVRHCQHLDL